MSNLNQFVKSSKTFNSFVFNGNYDMNVDVFIRLFDYYLETGKNLLDDYSNYIYMIWDMNEDQECRTIYDYEKIEECFRSLSNLRASNILNYDDIWDVISFVREQRKRFTKYLESKYNEPRRKATKFTSMPEVKEFVFKKYGKICLCCGSDKNITLDHVVSVYNGGRNDIDNLQPLCRSCNSKKGTAKIDYR